MTTKRYPEAEGTLKNARNIVEKTLGSQDNHLAVIFEALSMVYEKTGRTMEGKEYAARAHKIRKPEHMRKPETN